MPNRTLSGGEDFDMDGGYGRRRRGLGASAEKPTRRRKSDFFIEQIASWSKEDSGF
jgi:hypothetical protein